MSRAFAHNDCTHASMFAGRLVQVPALTEVQDKVYSEPTVLLAQQVSGEEEIPEGVVAVLTPDAPDILSHSSVRARNMKVCNCFWFLCAFRDIWERP